MKMKCLVLSLTFIPLVALAGGSNYGITPGAHPNLAGKVSEWPVPTPRFARDPAVAPDGSIYVAVMNGNKVAHFDPKTQKFREWDLPSGHRPHGLLVDRQGMVWTTGNGNGTIGKLDPATGRMIEFKTPSGRGGPHTLIITEDQSTIWFTMQSGDKVASIDTKSGAIKEYPSSGGPYGLALDKAGNVWFCRMGDNKMGKLDPKTGQMSEVDTGRGSRPRRVAATPDGMLWVTYYGNGRWLFEATDGNQYYWQEGANDGIGPPAPSPIATLNPVYRGDGEWEVWANEINTDTVVRFDPKSEQMRVVQLPSSNVGIRKMVTDASGRLWYMGSHNGRLGLVE